MSDLACVVCCHLLFQAQARLSFADTLYRLCLCSLNTSTSASSSSSSEGRTSGSLSSQQRSEQDAAQCQERFEEEPSLLPDVSYIPVFGSTATILLQRHVQDPSPQQQGRLGCHPQCGNESVKCATGSEGKEKSDASAAADLAQGMQQLGINDASFQQHSLSLALEHSSSDWHPQPLDNLVAYMGAAPAWLCGSESSGFELFGSSRLAACSGAEPVPAHVPKLCVTVSTISSQLDSLAILPLCAPQPAQAEATSAGLSGSQHLGEF